MPPPLLPPPDPPPRIIPIWGCDHCGLLFKCYNRALVHCRNSQAHTDEISTARESGGTIAAETVAAAILTWYQRIPACDLREVQAAVSAAQLVATVAVQTNSALRRAIRTAIETPQKEPVVVVGKRARGVDDDAADVLQRKKTPRCRRRRSASTSLDPPARDSLSPAPSVLAVFRVSLQSLAEFTTADSPVHFPRTSTRHFFQFVVSEDAARTPGAMMRSMELQYRRTSDVKLDWWAMIKHNWFIRGTAIRRDIVEMNVGEDNFERILPWLKRRRGEEWNWLMVIG